MSIKKPAIQPTFATSGQPPVVHYIQYAPESCALCGGDGKDFARPCAACGGQGSVLVAQPAHKCATCGGDGKDFAMECKVCNGSGWAHTYRRTVG